jgi:hypothetical protein
LARETAANFARPDVSFSPNYYGEDVVTPFAKQILHFVQDDAS